MYRRAVSLLIFVSSMTLWAQKSGAPRYTSAGELVRPDNYREWVFLSSGLGMTYGPAASQGEPLFDNVWAEPRAYKKFLETGTWPDKTVLVLEIRRSLTESSINKGGRIQGDVRRIEIEVKDEKRFPDKWAFFDFAPEAKVGTLIKDTRCKACHSVNGAVDNTFVQFYPVLRDVARAKKTFREEVMAVKAAGQ